MPIILALERRSGQVHVPANSTIFEFNPWEMGSYDTGTAAFAPLQFIGSNFTDGSVPRNGECIAGYDNAGFVMGTSSSLFNQALLDINSASDVPNFLINAINDTLGELDENQRDIALWPNPFYRYRNTDYNNKFLTLVDGGEALQNIPLQPLTIKERHVDVIFAVDASADTASDWPNGTALVATSNQLQPQGRFPAVPDQNTFVNLGLNRRPTFFGCNATNDDSGPLVVYLPNTPYSFHSNVSTFDLQFSDQERSQIIQNGYNVATRGNGTQDSQWTTCVGCALLARSLARTSTNIPSSCVDCFSRYCWNGTTNSTEPNTYEPPQIQDTSAARQIWGRDLGTFALAVILVIFAI
jgi:lysophospholipase